jgi:superfamily I DNA/RNA helicase
VPPRAVFADRGLSDAVVAVLADDAAGLGERDADDAGEVPAGRVAVLAPTARVADLRARVLPDAGGDGSGEPDLDAPVVVLPVSAAKGLEFDAVVLVEPAELVAESPRGLNDLYVALTRATQRLTVVHRAPLPPVLHRLGE